MNMVLKSMRDATPQEGPFSSQQEKMFTGMLDQQLSQNLAKRGVGLADVLVRQLSHGAKPGVAGTPAIPGTTTTPGTLTTPNKTTPMAVTPATAAAAANQGALSAMGIRGLQDLPGATEAENDPELRALAPGRLGNAARMYYEASKMQLSPNSESVAVNSAGSDKLRSAQPQHVRAFQDRLNAHAEQASRETGIPAKFMLGQAALESAWGKKEIATADGRPSHNLFGIKATSGWKGKVVEAVTTEYVNGVPHSKREKFRAYDSYAEGFRDYAKLLTKNPRYEKVIANAQDASSFAHGLQRAGYATDPNYATKLTRIINNSLS